MGFDMQFRLRGALCDIMFTMIRIVTGIISLKITCAIMLITTTMMVATLRESLLLLLLSSIWIS